MRKRRRGIKDEHEIPFVASLLVGAHDLLHKFVELWVNEPATIRTEPIGILSSDDGF
jgi:hypothetical protein